MASVVPNNKNGGRKKGHKFKSLLVWQHLLKNTDEDRRILAKLTDGGKLEKVRVSRSWGYVPLSEKETI